MRLKRSVWIRLNGGKAIFVVDMRTDLGAYHMAILASAIAQVFGNETEYRIVKEDPQDRIPETKGHGFKYQDRVS